MRPPGARTTSPNLTAICDELFPEFATRFTDPNAAGALALRAAFPTPYAVSTATQADLVAVRVGAHPSTVKLRQVHAVAATSGGRDERWPRRALAAMTWGASAG